MPFKSQKQRAYFYAAAERGEIPKKTVKKWEEETPKGKKLPKYVKSKKKSGKSAFLDGFIFELEKHAKDMLPGGLADKKKPSDFDKGQLEEGVKHELEHTSSKSIAREIAMDHLAEDPEYYEKLKKIEKKSALMTQEEERLYSFMGPMMRKAPWLKQYKGRKQGKKSIMDAVLSDDSTTGSAG